ncbi:hypothetical protein PanWU01x14_196430 [Parasponia andersonii]|uniref:Uncharacterized protein n=1 Tax=Parasponia andersonii TaxID=3476 RepID=A0A2P5BZK6_PARAD|nr:hypothetical protein PanWU01x14_196430 [Parasponia andersonii]
MVVELKIAMDEHKRKRKIVGMGAKK